MTIDEIIAKALRGNPDAIGFFGMLYSIFQVWDDLIDRDKKVSDNDINNAFWRALVELPLNPFYRANFNALHPLLSTSILNWHAANRMEATDSEADKEIAFIIRSAYVDLLIQSALIVGGVQWAIEMTPAIRRFWHGEGLAGYKAALAEQFERAES